MRYFIKIILNTPDLSADHAQNSSIKYRYYCWNKLRGVVVSGRRLMRAMEAIGKQLSLFVDDPEFARYRYSTLVTGMELPAAAPWRFNRDHADCENQH